VEYFCPMSYKPSIPKGTRDFSPEVLFKRNYIFDIIRQVYTIFGFLPIETPAMENLETLTGKYGTEGDKLLFKILNSGNFLEGIEKESLPDLSPTKISNLIAEKGLRYDLTVPFARFVVQHRNEITLPFKRYQIQPVWRADRPQKGRYREFFQCDADIIGSEALVNEFELIQIMDHVFQKMGIDVDIKLNNRKLLAGLAEMAGAGDRFFDFTVAIDKLDKTDLESVLNDLSQLGIPPEKVLILHDLFLFNGAFNEKLDILETVLHHSETGMKGLLEMRQLYRYIQSSDLQNNIKFDLTLARGLNYYTGAIFEVTASAIKFGSLCGGGRYDDLTGIFGMPGLSGVGISFGADRIYDVMSELNLFPDGQAAGTRVLFVNFGGDDEQYCLKAISRIREQNISAELYPDAAKLRKQMTYADARQIPYVVLAGEDERKKGMFTIKSLNNGKQQMVGMEDLISILQH
jgi:histidyl-tRNA synthetase